MSLDFILGARTERKSDLRPVGIQRQNTMMEIFGSHLNWKTKVTRVDEDKTAFYATKMAFYAS